MLDCHSGAFLEYVWWTALTKLGLLLMVDAAVKQHLAGPTPTICKHSAAVGLPVSWQSTASSPLSTALCSSYVLCCTMVKELPVLMNAMTATW